MQVAHRPFGAAHHEVDVIAGQHVVVLLREVLVRAAVASSRDDDATRGRRIDQHVRDPQQRADQQHDRGVGRAEVAERDVREVEQTAHRSDRGTGRRGP